MGGTGKYLKIDPNQALYHPNQHKVIFTGLYLANQRVDVEKKCMTGESCYKRIFSCLMKLQWIILIVILHWKFLQWIMEHSISFNLHIGWMLKRNGSALKEIESISTNCLQGYTICK